MISPKLEIIHPDFPRGNFRVAVFDFDGTVSLLRRNWQGIMIPMMVDRLAATGTDESLEALERLSEDIVMRLTGKPTLHQMQALADAVAERGQQPSDPHRYLEVFQQSLGTQIELRIQGISSGSEQPDEHMVPGARGLLESLRDQGLTLCLASGTLLGDVLREVELLGLGEFFGSRVFGPEQPGSSFSKHEVVTRLCQELDAAGSQVIGFGDGPAETEAVKAVGGLAIGVASNEETGTGVCPRKCKMLISTGADIIVGDYTGRNCLLETIGFRAG